LKRFSIALVIIFVAFALYACRQSHGLDSQFTITSSTPLIPLSEALASKSKSITGIPIVVKGSLGQEDELLRKNLTDLIITNQDLIADSKNAEFDKKVIASDRTIVVTSIQNKVNFLTKGQLQKIFNGEIKNWAQLGGANRQIQVLTREPGASIRLSFESQFLTNSSEGNERFSLNALAVNSNPEMRSAISSIPGSIGYLSIGAQSDNLKRLRIVDDESGKEIEAPLLTVYAFWRSADTNEQLQSFLQFLNKNQAAKEVIIEEGFMLP
jgi:phosphate transport system substrate-binding protein